MAKLITGHGIDKGGHRIILRMFLSVFLERAWNLVHHTVRRHIGIRFLRIQTGLELDWSIIGVHSGLGQRPGWVNRPGTVWEMHYAYGKIVCRFFGLEEFDLALRPHVH